MKKPTKLNPGKGWEWKSPIVPVQTGDEILVWYGEGGCPAFLPALDSHLGRRPRDLAFFVRTPVKPKKEYSEAERSNPGLLPE